MRRSPARSSAGSPPKRRGLSLSSRSILGAIIPLLAVATIIMWQRGADTPEGSDGPTPAASYVEPAACNGCHREIWETYRQTGMGRSFNALGSDAETVGLETSEPFYHEASDRYYSMAARNGALFQRRHQSGPAENVVEKQVHFVMGSGNHARTYLHRTTTGKLLQLPLGWYAEGGGIWQMSPGYDRPNHDGFQRVISYDCMFCHNGYPDLPPGADLLGRRALFPGRIPEGIDCQRCHGPGSEHVRAATGGDASAGAVRGSIANPARMRVERQREVCFQCHLEATSRPLPNRLHVFGRGHFSYRPGEPLSRHSIFFDHAPGSGWDEKFEINHSAYRLMQSRCFAEAGEALSCTTCHDPHKPSGTVEAARRYDSACTGCHESRLATLASAGEHLWRSDCTGCHMPKRRTDDVVHAVMTDHRIQASPPAGLLAPKLERSTLADTAYRGEVVRHFPPSLPGAERELYAALAQVAQGSNVAAGIARLEAAINRHKPAEAGFYFELGAALDEADRPSEAARWLGRAVTLDPRFTLAWIRLGSALSKAGDHGRAEQALLRAAELDPLDPRIPKERGMDLARQGLYERAADASRAAIGLDPDLPELHNNLGGALAELGRIGEAETALREAIRLQPDLAEARFNLGAVLAGRGDATGAARQWRAALRSDPGFAAARFNLAVILARDGQREEALAHLDAALEDQPTFERARALRDDIARQGSARDAP